jgi:hypothetical protein
METEYRRQILLGWTLAGLFCFGGVVLIGWGWTRYAEMKAFVDGARTAPGRVVGFDLYDAPGPGLREDIHYAVIRYRTADGEQVRFRGPSRDGPARLNEGDEVRVLYHPDAPEQARVDSFMGLWFVPVILWIVGFGVIAVPLWTMREAHRWVRRQPARE